jgi:hypothetical protein
MADTVRPTLPGRRAVDVVWFFAWRGLALALGLTLGACAGGEDVTGIWRTRDAPVVLPAATEGPRFMDGSYLVLAIGQYGRDVAGVIKFFEAPSATIERCPCSFVFNGVRRGDRLTFLFEACAVDHDEPALMRAELQLVGDDETDIVLTGDVFLVAPETDGPAQPGLAATGTYFTSLTLQGTRQTKIPSHHLLCRTAQEGDVEQ